MGGEIGPMPHRYHLGEILLEPNLFSLHLLSPFKPHSLHRYHSPRLSSHFPRHIQFTLRPVSPDILVCKQRLKIFQHGSGPVRPLGSNDVQLPVHTNNGFSDWKDL